MSWLRARIDHHMLPHCSSLQEALTAMAIARFAGYPVRRAETCVCGKFLIRLER